MHIDTQSGLPISIANMLRVNFVPRRRSPHALFHPSTSTGVGGGGWVGGGGVKLLESIKAFFFINAPAINSALFSHWFMAAILETWRLSARPSGFQKRGLVGKLPSSVTHSHTHVHRHMLSYAACTVYPESFWSAVRNWEKIKKGKKEWWEEWWQKRVWVKAAVRVELFNNVN